MTDGTTIGQWHSLRRKMEVQRILTRALRGGTEAMWRAGTTLTPMDSREREHTDSYRDRLFRTTLFEAYADTIRGIVDAPFQRAIEVKGNESLPPTLQALEANCDRSGMPLTMLGRKLMDAGADTGLACVLIDKPGVLVRDAEDGPVRAMTMLEEQRDDVRPYFSIVHPDNLLSWSWRMDNGKRVLAAIAIYSDASSVDPETMRETSTQMIRLWTETKWETWERVLPVTTFGAQESPRVMKDAVRGSLFQVAQDQANATAASENLPYQLTASGPNPLGVVPFVFRNFTDESDDPLSARPPMLGLAWKNLDDWLTTSALSNNLQWHGMPMIAIAGADADVADNTKPIRYGAGATIISRNESMTASFIESAGTSAANLAQRLDAIRAEEQALGMAPFVEQVADSGTAAGVHRGAARSQSRIQAWAELVEWLLYDAYQMAMRWETGGRDDELPEDFDLAVFRDFSVSTRAQTDLAVLTQARAARDISQPTYLSELKKRGTLDSALDVELEVEETSGEREASMAQFAMPGAPQQQQDAEEDPEQDPNEEPEDPAEADGSPV